MNFKSIFMWFDWMRYGNIVAGRNRKSECIENKVRRTKLVVWFSKAGMKSIGWSGTGVWAGSSGKNLFNTNNTPVIGQVLGAQLVRGRREINK